ncbi:MAG TPA: hypothetical protein VMP67_05235 [Candidatus Limnocylindria bacterium]|nr:hypothetical protein [Candidatus Limnocylindria bacterium]
MSFTGSSMGRHASFRLIVTGFIELGLAVVFLVLGLIVPFADFGLYLTAAVLASVGIGCLLFGLRLRRSVAATERLLASGLEGRATVTGLTQTGMYLNENPQVTMDLSVELPGRTPYPAQRKEFVPLILLGRLSSGAPLPASGPARSHHRRALVHLRQRLRLPSRERAFLESGEQRTAAHLLEELAGSLDGGLHVGLIGGQVNPHPDCRHHLVQAQAHIAVSPQDVSIDR